MEAIYEHMRSWKPFSSAQGLQKCVRKRFVTPVGTKKEKKAASSCSQDVVHYLYMNWRNTFKGEASVRCLTDSIARGPGRRRQLRQRRAAWTVPRLQRLRLSRRRKMEDTKDPKDTKDTKDMRVFPPHLGGTDGDRWGAVETGNSIF